MQVVALLRVISSEGVIVCLAERSDMVINDGVIENSIDRSQARLDDLIVDARSAIQNQFRELRAQHAAGDG